MKIGIFTAMEKEAASFLKNNNAKHIQCGAFSVYNFSLGEHDAYLCCPPSVGEIAAAGAVQLLISRFDVNCVLNFGVVGALTESTALLSTVYVSSVVHYDMDTSAFDGCEVGRYDCFGETAVRCNEKMLNAALKVKLQPTARCASADKFVSSAEDKALLHKKFGADICDMESAAVVFTCTFNRVPFLCVKTVSDSLVGGAEEFAANAERAAEGFFHFARKLADVL